MNTGQQIITVGALFLLSLLVLMVYRTTGTRSTSNYENEAILTGTSIGQSMLEEITSKAFDENTISSSAKTPSDLSAVLGPDIGESTVSQFDDVDDFKNYTTSDSLERMGRYDIKVDVYYVEKMHPDVRSYVRTFTKRIDVKLTNRNIPDTLQLNYVVAY